MLFYSTSLSFLFCFFFFNDTATTEIYTLSLHDALPICAATLEEIAQDRNVLEDRHAGLDLLGRFPDRSEEHTSELQSRLHLVCRLLLEKKKKKYWMLCAAALGQNQSDARDTVASSSYPR